MSNPTLFVAAHWSLNYEEQFYIVMGLLMLVAAGRRAFVGSMVMVLVPVAFAFTFFSAPLFFGIFLEMWVPFAAGAIAYQRLCRENDVRRRRWLDAALVAIFIYGGVMTVFGSQLNRSSGIYASAAFGAAIALTLVYLRRFDETLMCNRIGTILSLLGLVSYSLYLTHQFNLGLSARVAEAIIAIGLPDWSGRIVQLAILILIAILFWLFCERPFLNPRAGQAK
jgi:peptidoglycan/LPS O-acetylase OafA/YrhL